MISHNFALRRVCQPRQLYWLSISFLLFFFLYDGESRESHDGKISLEQCDGDACSKRSRRYILYEINPGEGFNLRRDIFIRVAPLVKSLNKYDKSHEWVLVLPPWGMVPHWKRTNPDNFYPWSTFFQIDQIQNYVPAIELTQFMDEYGYDNPIDIAYQLQHFPFEDNGDWSDKVETGVRCEHELQYKRSPDSKLWHGAFWGQPIQARAAKCMAFRGQSSALRKFILEKKFKSVMFDRAEVILWDSYGDSNFWTARESLVFAARLQQVALDFIINHGLTPSINISIDESIQSESNATKLLSIRREYLATHLRRADFMLGRLASELPTIPSTARQIMHKLQALSLSDAFIATDATKMEVIELKNHIQNEMPGATVYFFRSEKFSDGECAIIDQIICSFSKYFIGTRDSTFTLRIFEEREIMGFQPETNYNYLCPDTTELNCDKATEWRKTN